MSDTIQQALSHCNPGDREIWLRMGMAIHSELGAQGFDIWDEWSSQWEDYRETECRSTWRSFKPGGGITIASLFFEAKANGWVDDGTYKPTRRIERDDRDHEAERHKGAVIAAKRAQAMVESATYDKHIYLSVKGFTEEMGLVLNDELLIPMRDLKTNRILSLQRIKPDGSKLFLKGGRASGAAFCLGAGSEVFLCEGYATGLSVRAALKSLYRQSKVVVCFSAANIAAVAKQTGHYVIADNDASGTGQKFAEKTGLPWWMPPEVGMDANDYHRSAGVDALAAELVGLVSQKDESPRAESSEAF